MLRLRARLLGKTYKANSNMKILNFLLLTCSLFATVNQPLRVEWLTGYRNDRIHWHLEEPGSPSFTTYSELMRDVEYWENGLVLSWVSRDLSFYFRGNYGTLGRGDLFQSYPGLSDFQFTTHGWCADAVGYFGYAVNLTAGRLYKAIFTPLIGYSGYFEQLRRSGGNELSQLPGDFRLVWNGVLLGGTFGVQPGGPLEFKAGYSFHFMHNRVHTKVQNSLNGSETVQLIRATSGGNNGHSGWLQMDWAINPHWRVGINGLIYYFSTRVVDANIRKTGRGNFSEKLKLRWTVIKAAAQISRQF